mgnify:CR=1 FL=1
MELEAFLQHVKERKPLNTPEIYEIHEPGASDEARRITFELNGAIIPCPRSETCLPACSEKPVDPSFRVFPPFYTDFGKNITVGKNVFINACCHFQDQGGITFGRQLSGRTQCCICHAEPWFCPRRTAIHASRPHRCGT